jgi:hypothetical protein
MDYAQFKIPYYIDGYNREESIASITGNTYNLENWAISKVELQKNSIYEEDINNNWKQKVFAMPGVKVGSIVEIKYVLESPFFFNLPDWEFQSTIPTVYSKYQASMIPFYTYELLMQGATKFDEYSSEKDKGFSRQWRSMEFQDMIYKYALKNVPSFDMKESFISSPNDYIIKIDFQLAKYYSPTGGNIDIITTWSKLNEELTDHSEFGKYVKKARSDAKTIFETELALDALNINEKAKKIIEYTKANFSWDEYYGKYVRVNPKELIKKREGSCAEINLFMAGMLQEAGIDAKPVILSTRGHGKVWTQYPFASFFNYVAVLVNTGTETYLADATERVLPHNRIPTRAMNAFGLVVIDKQESWVDLTTSNPSVDKKYISININPEKLNADVSVSIIQTEFEGFNARKRYKNDTSIVKDSFIKQGFSEINSVNIKDFDDHTKPHKMSVKGTYPIESFSNQIVVKPFLNFPIAENKLKHDKRTYNVDFIYRQTEQYNCTLTLPENYEISYVPENLNVNDELMTIMYDVKKLGNMITISGVIEYKKAIYTPEEYPKLKAHIDSVVRQFNESVVLKKKE